MSAANFNNPDFTFQISPEAQKTFVQQTNTFNCNIKANDSLYHSASATQKQIDDLININKKCFTSDQDCYTEEIFNERPINCQFIQKSTQIIKPFQILPEPEKVLNQERENQGSPQNQHSIQSYLRMLAFKALKGDEISIQSSGNQDIEQDSKSSTNTNIASLQKIILITTESDIENNSHKQKLQLQDYQQNNFSYFSQDLQSEFDNSFKKQYSIFCRICKKEGLKSIQREQQIINPCSCEGKNYWVHSVCLETEIRQNLEYFLENPQQQICCKTCMTPYQLSLFKSRNWSRYRDIIPCFIFIFALLGLMLFFLIKFIQEVSMESIEIGSALINFYIFVFIIFVCILIIFLTLKMLEQYKLKINKYQNHNQINQIEQQQTREMIIQYLKETNPQFL